MTPNQLPPLPEPDGQMTVTFGIDEKRKVPVFFGAKLTAYALAALAQQAQEPVALGLPIHNLRTMANGLRAVEVVNKRFIAARLDEIADYLRDLERATPPAPQVPAPVDEEIIAGVLFDFMGWLTSREKRIVLSSADFASPAAEAIRDFAQMRGLDISKAAVRDWQARAALQSPAPQTKGQP